MSLKLPEYLEHYWHDAIVKNIIKLNPRFHNPNRGSWLEGIPDLEDASREVVEVALTNLRDSWGQCLHYYRMNATHIHLVLAPKLYLDYQNKEKAFIKQNPIPNVDIYALPAIPEHDKPIRIEKKQRERNPKAEFTVTTEEREQLKHVVQPQRDTKEGLDVGINSPSKKIHENIKKEQNTDEDNTPKQLDSRILTEKMNQFDLVPVLSPCNQLSYITREDYEESTGKNSSDKINFWRPLK